jgi:hypothetical protein
MGTDAAFYAYAYPEPAGFGEYPVDVPAAHYDPNLGEFILPYEHMRRADDPDATLLRFLQRTYEAAAVLARWDRPSLERQDGGVLTAPAQLRSLESRSS